MSGLEPLVIPLLVASTAVSAGGAIYQGQQQKKAAEFNAQVAERNAVAAQNKAKYDEGIHRDRVKALLSKQRAIIGKSGLQLEGSPLLALLDTTEQGELDALAIRHGGDVQAARYRSSATASRMQGSAARTGSYLKAGSTLLSGAASAGLASSKLTQLKTP